MNMFAIVKTGGKQYRVSEGDIIRVEKLTAEAGSSVNLPVLMLGSEKVAFGGTVTAQVVRHVMGKKIYIDKYKSGIQYRRRNGHRQEYTDVKIIGVAA
jgi:large subunit ribosomal protein L21